MIYQLRQNQVVTKYQKLKVLGKGAFATCYQIRNLETNQLLAAKTVSKQSLQNSNRKSKLESEILIHQSLAHDHIVKFVDTFQDLEHVYLILELCSNQTLNDLLQQNKRFTIPETQKYLSQILEALKYLHKRNIIHRDLKLSNLFLDSKMNIKIGDFGLSTKLKNQRERTFTQCGTPNYMAPEILKNSSGYSIEVDIWSLGILMYTMLVGKHPFEGQEIKQTYQNIRKNQYSHPEDNDQLYPPARELIRSLLNPDASKRPNIYSIKNHSFFNCLQKISISSFHLKNQSSLAQIKEYYSPRVESQMIDFKKKSTSEYQTQQKPGVWIKKWLDYSNKYGLGYILHNGQCGVNFNDGSKMLLSTVQQKYLFVDKDGKQQYYQFNDSNSKFEKKFKLLINFKNFFKEEETNQVTFAYLRKWKKNQDYIKFEFNNNIIQFHFSDKSQLLIDHDLKYLEYLDTQGKNQQYKLPFVGTDQNIEDKLRRIREEI